MRPFDEAAARAGAKFVARNCADMGAKYSLSFVGLTSNGRVVGEYASNPGQVSDRFPCDLCMVPTKVTNYMPIYTLDDGAKLNSVHLFNDVTTATRCAEAWIGHRLIRAFVIAEVTYEV